MNPPLVRNHSARCWRQVVDRCCWNPAIVLEDPLAADVGLLVFAADGEVEADARRQRVAPPLRRGEQAEVQLRLPSAALLEYVDVPG